MAAGAQQAHLETILDYFHAKARQRSEVIGLSPLTLYLHLTSHFSEDSVALPDAPGNEDVSAVLPQVNAYFTHRRRTPRIQFVDSQCPSMEGQLTENGYTLDEKLPLLTCTPTQLQPPARRAPLELTVFTADSAEELLVEGWQLNIEGFNGRRPTSSTGDANLFRQMLGTGRAYSAHVEGVGVGAGMFYEPVGGVAEIVGITTLRPFRRRGVASTLTAEITAAAFDAGAEIAFLVAASPEAVRVYLRLGYEFHGHLITMSYPLKADSPS